VALLVPCHRAIRRDGSLGGYRWGLDKKRELLARERRAAESNMGAAAGNAAAA
jgi:AraC family transcriptional regulator of adaptative response/methylated-DNA-[protein]-cysteine methyltransferase